jgi:hypothetical protein
LAEDGNPLAEVSLKSAADVKSWPQIEYGWLKISSNWLKSPSGWLTLPVLRLQMRLHWLKIPFFWRKTASGGCFSGDWLKLGQYGS